MSYKVDYNALDALYAGIEKQTVEWEQELDAIYTALGNLATTNQMSGSGFQAIKDYFQVVHNPILNGLSSLLTLHRQSCLLYKQDYQQNVDTALNVVVEESELSTIRDNLKVNRESAVSIYNEVEYELSQIRDIFSVNYRDVSEVEKAHNGEDAHILQLDEDIKKLESRHTSQDFQETGTMTRSLSSFVHDISSKGRAYKTTFSANSLLRSASYKTLYEAGVAVDARQKALTSKIGDAEELEKNRMKAIEEAALPAGVLAMGAVLRKDARTSGKLFGVNSGASAKGEVLSGEVKTIGKATWSPGKGEVGAETGISASGRLAGGEAKANFGALQGKVEGAVGSGEVSGKVSATLFKDGKLSPVVEGKAKAEASALSGKAEIKLGNDNIDGHITAKGSVGHAEAEASGGVGKIAVVDENGNETTGFGVQGKVKAEVCAAEGKINGGFTFAGIKIEAGIKGKAGAAGVEAGGGITTGGAHGTLGASLGVGAGIEFSIDWSGFKGFT